MKKKAAVDPLEHVQQIESVDSPDYIDPLARTPQKQEEFEAWQRWSQDRNSAQGKKDFAFLLESYKPLMFSTGKRLLQTGQLPDAAIKADMVQHLHRAMETYDQSKGAQLNTHIVNHLRHTGRFLRTYTNIGKIPEPRAQQVGMYQARTSQLQDILGRDPTTQELADDLNVDNSDIELLRKELRRDILTEEKTQGMSEFAEETPKALEQMHFLHMELNPEQQNVLEHTYGMHGRLPVETNEDLARVLNMTPQKVRAIKRQIAKRYEKRYR
jgi:DNA-directed RNA polymerase specialized sigma subunit